MHIVFMYTLRDIVVWNITSLLVNSEVSSFQRMANESVLFTDKGFSMPVWDTL